MCLLMNNSSLGSTRKQHLYSTESSTLESHDGSHYSSALYFLNVTKSESIAFLTLRNKERQWCGDKERGERRGEQ